MIVQAWVCLVWEMAPDLVAVFCTHIEPPSGHMVETQSNKSYYRCLFFIAELAGLYQLSATTLIPSHTQLAHDGGKYPNLGELAYIGWIWGFWDFPLGSRFYPRIRPHNPAIQIDTIHATLFPQGPPGRWYCEESKH